MRKTNRPSSKTRLADYLRLSGSILEKPFSAPGKFVGATMAIGVLGALHSVDAQIVYSGAQNVACNLPGHLNRCYANIDLAGGNDFEIVRNNVGGFAFIQADEVASGGFSVNGFNGNAAGGYVYPYALNINALIGPAGPWNFQAGQANTMADNGGYPGPKWELPNGSTRFLGIRGTKSGQTKYGWVRVTVNSFGNYTIVDWAYNNTTNTAIAAGQIATAANVTLSGRVRTADGRGIPNAILTFTDSHGRVLYARSSSFGYFVMEGIESGETVVISVQGKGHSFENRVVTVNDSINDLDIVPVATK